MIRKLATVTLFFLGQSAPCAPEVVIPEQTKQRDPETAFVALIKDGQSDRVRGLINTTPNKDQNWRVAWRAVCFTSEDRFEEAARLFDRVENLDRASPYILGRAAMAYGYTQEVDKSLRCANQSIARGGSIEAYKARAACNSQNGKVLEAAADWKQLASLDPVQAKKYLMKAAQNLYRAGKHSEGIEVYSVASKTREGYRDPGILIGRALCYEELGKWNQAVIDLTKAIKLGSDELKAGEAGANLAITTSFKERAKCYDKLGKKDLAAADRKSLEKFSHSLESDLFGDMMR